MALSVAEALADPLLSAAQPRVVSGRDHMAGRSVRWAHASEQLDVAQFLVGGELVIMEGVHLADEPPTDVCRDYAESLSAAGVAALAIELGGRMMAVPPALLSHARSCGLIVVELHRRVPFVQICQSLNTRLAEQNLRHIQESDRLSSSLMSAVAAGADVPKLLALIAAFTGGDVALYGLDGRCLRVDAGVVAPATSATPRAAFSVPLEAAGSPLGTLVLSADVAANVDSIAVALDRTPEILSVTILRSAPPSRRERLTGQLLRQLARPAETQVQDDMDLLLRELHLVADAQADRAFLSVRLDVGSHADLVDRARKALEAAAERHVMHFHGEMLVALMSFESRSELEQARSRLVASLREVTAAGAAGCLGVGTTGRAGLLHEHSTAMNYRTWVDLGSNVLWDARDFHLRRLAVTLAANDEVTAFLDDVLGAVRSSPQLLSTLATYAAVWGNKTAAANRLGIGRQALYDRLERIERIIGPLDGKSARNSAVIVAALVSHPNAVGDPDPLRLSVKGEHGIR